MMVFLLKLNLFSTFLIINDNSKKNELPEFLAISSSDLFMGHQVRVQPPVKLSQALNRHLCCAGSDPFGELGRISGGV